VNESSESLLVRCLIPLMSKTTVSQSQIIIDNKGILNYDEDKPLMSTIDIKHWGWSIKEAVIKRQHIT
jgi:hypothetical protein